jgi:hypothetical protein
MLGRDGDEQIPAVPRNLKFHLAACGDPKGLSARLHRLRKKSIFDAQPLKSVRENWVVPPGLEIISSTFPSAEALG